MTAFCSLKTQQLGVDVGEAVERQGHVARVTVVVPRFAGQGMGLTQAVRPAREVLEEPVTDAVGALSRSHEFC